MKTGIPCLLLIGLAVSSCVARSAAAEDTTGSPQIKLLPAAAPAEMRQPKDLEALPSASSPAGTAKLSLADLEAMALTKNPSLAQFSARVEAQRGEWIQAGLPPNPTVGYSGSEIGNDGRAGQQGGFVEQEFVTGGKLRLSRAVAAGDVSVAEQRLSAQRYRVLSDVRINFYDVLVAQRRIEITNDLLGLGQRALDTAESFLKREEGNKVDLLQARVEANSARILLETSRNDHTAAWRKLASSVGSPDLPPTSLTGDLEANIPEISFDDAMQKLLAESPELAVARANVNRAQQALRRACAERIPNVDIQAGAAHDNATHDDIANVQIGIPIPVWNRNQGGIHRAQAELAAAQSDVQRVELDLHNRLASTYQRYANAKQQVDAYKRDILPDAKSSLEMVNNGYKQGEFRYLALLTSQRTFFQTNLLYLDSLQELRRSSTEIEDFLLTDSLKTDDTSR